MGNGVPAGYPTIDANTVVGRLTAGAGPAEAIDMEDLADAIVAELGAALVSAEISAMRGTSPTSLSIGTGPKAFATQANKGFDGQFVKAYSAADPTKYVFGLCAYASTTATLTVAAGGTGGSGTVNDWVLVVTGPQGITGATGATGDMAAATYAFLVSMEGANDATPGLIFSTANNTATKRVLTGESNKVVITNPSGVAGDPTITLGTKALVTDTGKTLASQVAIQHTAYSIGSGLTGATTRTLALADGEYQTLGVTSGTCTISLPTAGSGRIKLLVTSSNATAVAAAADGSWDKTLTGTPTFTASTTKKNLLAVEVIDGFAIAQWTNVA